MKKVMILLMLCGSFTVSKAKATEGIEIIESIENGDAEGLINALNREKPAEKELNAYISLAKKKYDSLWKKLGWSYMAQHSSTLALGLGAWITFLAGMTIGAGTEFYLSRDRESQERLWKGVILGGVVGGGASIKGGLAIESYLNLNQKINDLNRRLKKAHSILLILKDALQKREK